MKLIITGEAEKMELINRVLNGEIEVGTIPSDYCNGNYSDEVAQQQRGLIKHGNILRTKKDWVLFTQDRNRNTFFDDKECCFPLCEKFLRRIEGNNKYLAYVVPKGSILYVVKDECGRCYEYPFIWDIHVCCVRCNSHCDSCYAYRNISMFDDMYFYEQGELFELVNC